MNKKQKVMELWRNNFDDSEAFIRFYFASKYSDQNSLVYESDGQALSALLLLPYPMSWEGTILPTSYISGACTQPEARNRGLMTRLLQRAFIEMYRRGTAFSTLIPAEDRLFRYYGRLGYAPAFEYSLLSCPAETPEATELSTFSPEIFQEQWATALFPYFNRHQKLRPCCIQHPHDDFTAVLQDLYMTKGRAFIAFSENPGNPAGMALAQPEAERLVIKEMFWETPAARQALLAAAGRIFPERPIWCKTPPQRPDTRRAGMARIIRADRLLQQIAGKHPELSLTLQLNDPYLTANQGLYTLHRGKCFRPNAPQAPADLETDITTLTETLLGYRPEQLPPDLLPLLTGSPAYMNLMME